MREKIAIALLCAAALSGCATYERVHDYVYGPPRFIVFFSGDSATLTPNAKAIVKSAATRIASHHPASVVIAAGVTAGDNMELSAPRFAAVHDQLVADGVAEDLIARAPIPGPKLAETTAKAGTSTADQRVEIRLLDKAL
jgi:outer membrane protein OmpA-like peptidoglycan-associated protein